jgi:hypothetical protein
MLGVLIYVYTVRFQWCELLTDFPGLGVVGFVVPPDDEQQACSRHVEAYY